MHELQWAAWHVRRADLAHPCPRFPRFTVSFVMSRGWTKFEMFFPCVVINQVISHIPLSLSLSCHFRHTTMIKHRSFACEYRVVHGVRRLYLCENNFFAWSRISILGGLPDKGILCAQYKLQFIAISSLEFKKPTNLYQLRLWLLMLE